MTPIFLNYYKPTDHFEIFFGIHPDRAVISQHNANTIFMLKYSQLLELFRFFKASLFKKCIPLEKCAPETVNPRMEICAFKFIVTIIRYRRT